MWAATTQVIHITAGGIPSELYPFLPISAPTLREDERCRKYNKTIEAYKLLRSMKDGFRAEQRQITRTITE